MTVEALLDGLRDPACYPGAVGPVQIVQTHLSVVCLADDRVYKLKKSRKLPFVDFSSLAARRATCREEVRVVLLDGNFPTQERRAAAATAAFADGSEAVFVHVDVDPATALARATKRARDPANVSDAGPEQVTALRAKFLGPTSAEGIEVLRIDGARPTEELVAIVLHQLLARAPKQ